MLEPVDNPDLNGRSDAFWRKVYIAVIVNTFVVITALWAFSRYFSR